MAPLTLNEFEHFCGQIWMCHYFPWCVSVSSTSRICVNSGHKGYFLKMTSIQHFHSCLLVLPSFKSKIWNVFCRAIFLHFRMVWPGGLQISKKRLMDTISNSHENVLKYLIFLSVMLLLMRKTKMEFVYRWSQSSLTLELNQ